MESSNKRAVFVLILFVIVSIAFYSKYKNESNTENLSENGKIYVDPETGVNYIFYTEGTGRSAHAGLSVRYRRDGSVYVTSGMINMGEEE